MAQPDAVQIASHLRAAADQIGLFVNLPAVSEAPILQRILDGIEGLRNDILGWLALIQRSRWSKLILEFEILEAHTHMHSACKK